MRVQRWPRSALPSLDANDPDLGTRQTTASFDTVSVAGLVFSKRTPGPRRVGTEGRLSDGWRALMLGVDAVAAHLQKDHHTRHGWSIPLL